MDFNFTHGYVQNSQNSFASSFLPQNVSAYFRKPSKVVKPSSRNHSPRTDNRRRMTASFPTRNRSIAGPHRNGNDESHTYMHKSQNRPVSWHSSFQHQHPSQQAISQQVYQSPSNTAYAYGLVTPQTMPIADDFYINSQMMPFSLASGPQYTSEPVYSQASYMHLPEFDGHVSSYTPVSAPIYDATDYQLQNMAWPPLPNSNLNIATAPASPDFASLPSAEQLTAQMDADDGGEELVGMGLYDSPAHMQPSNLLLGGSLPIRRKSLKLEESFEPVAQSDEEEGDEEDVDAESEPEPEEQLPTQAMSYQQPVVPHVPDPIQQYYDSLVQDQLHSMPAYPSDMSGWI